MVDSRRKGSAGECRARKLLEREGYIVEKLSAGKNGADLTATDPGGKTWIVEVKDRKLIDVQKFVKQARQNAGSRPWMVVAHVFGTSGWLLLMQGCQPQILNEY